MASKTLTIRMPHTLYDDALSAAEQRRETLADLIRGAIQSDISGDDQHDALRNTIFEIRDDILNRLDQITAE